MVTNLLLMREYKFEVALGTIKKGNSSATDFEKYAGQIFTFFFLENYLKHFKTRDCNIKEEELRLYFMYYAAFLMLSLFFSLVLILIF